jgi:hypothetical protein
LLRLEERSLRFVRDASNTANQVSASAICVCQSVGLSVCRSVGLSVCRSVGLSVCRSVGLSVCLVFLACLPVCLPACLFCLSASLYRTGGHLAPSSIPPLWLRRRCCGRALKLTTLSRVVAQILSQVRALTQPITDIKSLLSTMSHELIALRRTYLSITRARDREPTELPALPTCANASNAFQPPCIHQLSRAPEFFTKLNFPLQFFKLWVLTDSGRRAYVAPGAFDGYTLVATAPCTLAAASLDCMLSVYNPYSLVLGQTGLPAVLVVTKGDGSIVRQVQLGTQSGAPLTDIVTGMATSQAKVFVAVQGQKVYQYSTNSVLTHNRPTYVVRSCWHIARGS